MNFKKNGFEKLFFSYFTRVKPCVKTDKTLLILLNKTSILEILKAKIDFLSDKNGYFYPKNQLITNPLRKNLQS